MSVPCILSCETWHVVQPGAWLARTPGPSASFKIPAPSRLWRCKRCPGGLEARSEACAALPLEPQQDYLFHFPNDGPARLNNNSLVVIGPLSRKQARSEEQCRWWSAVYYTSGLLVAKDPDQHLCKSFIHRVCVSKPASPNPLRLTREG